MGRFVAFVKRDFDAGLLMLAKGSDPDLARLADEDLCTTEQPSIQLKTADAWWRVADERGGDDRRVMRERAGFWYAKAAPNLDGLDRALAERPVARQAHDPARRGSARPWHTRIRRARALLCD